MATLDDFDLISIVFGESGSTLELIFAASALIGGVLFLFWFMCTIPFQFPVLVSQFPFVLFCSGALVLFCLPICFVLF